MNHYERCKLDPLVILPDDRIHVLSLHRPWPATFFQSGLARPKRIENRKAKPPKNVIGTWVCFHAAKAFDHKRLSLIVANAPEVSRDPQDHPTGLVGMAFIAGYTTDPIDLERIKNIAYEPLRIFDQRCWWLGPVAYLVPMVIPFDVEFQKQLYAPDRKTGALGPALGQQGWKFLSDKHAALIREKYGYLMHVTAAAAHHGTLKHDPITPGPAVDTRELR